MSHGRKVVERLSDKTVLITGASAGIGKATALEYCEATEGQIKLVLLARRMDKLQEIKNDLTSKFPNVNIHIEKFDVTQVGEAVPLIQSLPEDFKDIDILVNNAGKAIGMDRVGDIANTDVKEVFETNVFGLIALTQAVLPIFKSKNSGDIVNIGSVAGRDAYVGGSIYCATKFAVKSFTQALRQELTNTKIRVIEVVPGAVETEFSIVRWKGNVDKAAQVYKDIDPLYADDIADTIVYTTSRKQNTVIAEALVLPSCQASAQYIHRRN